MTFFATAEQRLNKTLSKSSRPYVEALRLSFHSTNLHFCRFFCLIEFPSEKLSSTNFLLGYSILWIVQRRHLRNEKKSIKEHFSQRSLNVLSLNLHQGTVVIIWTSPLLMQIEEATWQKPEEYSRYLGRKHQCIHICFKLERYVCLLIHIFLPSREITNTNLIEVVWVISDPLFVSPLIVFCYDFGQRWSTEVSARHSVADRVSRGKSRIQIIPQRISHLQSFQRRWSRNMFSISANKFAWSIVRCLMWIIESVNVGDKE